jgi:hypothetical protein
MLNHCNRVVGVVGGVWCCMGWAVKISYHAYEVVSGQKEGEVEIVAVETSGAKRRWGGGELKKRVVKQGNGWVVEGANDWGSPASTPYASNFGLQTPYTPSPGLGTPGFASSVPLPPSAPPTGNLGSGFFPGHSPSPSQSGFQAQSRTPSGGIPVSPLAGAQQFPIGPPQGHRSQGSISRSNSNSRPEMTEQQRALKDQ